MFSISRYKSSLQRSVLLRAGVTAAHECVEPVEMAFKPASQTPEFATRQEIKQKSNWIDDLFAPVEVAASEKSFFDQRKGLLGNDKQRFNSLQKATARFNFTDASQSDTPTLWKGEFLPQTSNTTSTEVSNEDLAEVLKVLEISAKIDPYKLRKVKEMQRESVRSADKTRWDVIRKVKQTTNVEPSRNRPRQHRPKTASSQIPHTHTSLGQLPPPPATPDPNRSFMSLQTSFPCSQGVRCLSNRKAQTVRLNSMKQIDQTDGLPRLSLSEQSSSLGVPSPPSSIYPSGSFSFSPSVSSSSSSITSISSFLGVSAPLPSVEVVQASGASKSLINLRGLNQLRTNLIVRKRRKLNQMSFVIPDRNSTAPSSLRDWSKCRQKESKPEGNLNNFDSLKLTKPSRSSVFPTRPFSSSAIPTSNFKLLIDSSPSAIAALVRQNPGLQSAIEASRQKLLEVQKSGVAVDVPLLKELGKFYGNSFPKFVEAVSKHPTPLIAQKLQRMSKVHLAKLPPPSAPANKAAVPSPSKKPTSPSLQAIQKLSLKQTFDTLVATPAHAQFRDREEIKETLKMEDVSKSEIISASLDYRVKQETPKSQVQDLMLRKATRLNQEELLQRQGKLLNPDGITLATFAAHLNVPHSSVSEIVEILLDEPPQMDTPLTVDEAKLIANEINMEDKLSFSASDILTESMLVSRPAIVAVIGHVNHGKTTLLDYLRRTSIAAGEAGKITQSVAAFEVRTPKTDTLLTFIDTPGHAAFTTMRKRGLTVADIAVLVVAADSGIQPQTLEAYETAREARVPIIVALTKIDKANSSIEEVRNEILARLPLISEIIPVSAKTGDRISDLEEALAFTHEGLQLKGNPSTSKASAFILEARKGVAGSASLVYSCILKQGQLKVGSHVFVGRQGGRVSSILTMKNGRLQTLLGSPKLGQPFEVTIKFESKQKHVDLTHGAGELLVRIETHKEWKQLLRFYEKRPIPLIHATPDPHTSISHSSSLSEFLEKSAPVPQLRLSFAAKDEGLIEAANGWVEEFNERKTEEFIERLTDEEQSQGKSTWTRASPYDSLFVPSPFVLCSTFLGVPSENQIEKIAECNDVLLMLGLEDNVAALTKLREHPQLKLRSHDIIYRLFEDLQVLYDFHFGPQILRHECAHSSPILGATTRTSKKMLMSIAEVSVSSGSLQVDNCAVDLLRRTDGRLSLVGRSIKIHSLATDTGKALQRVEAPRVINFSAPLQTVEFKVDDVIKWYTTEKAAAPFGDPRFVAWE